MFAIIACLCITKATAQNIRVPNSSFEIWDNLQGLIDAPDSWPSSDLLWYYEGYNTHNVYPDRHCHSGKYSARIGPDTAAKKIWPGFIAAKFAIGKIPEYFDFYYIDSLNQAESGAVKISLNRWNSSKKTEDSVGGVTWNFPNSIIQDFVFGQIPIDYTTVDTTIKPDSISITIEVVSSSTSLPAGHISIDDVSLVPHSSGIEYPGHTQIFHVVPNPSKGLIYIVSPYLINHSSKIEIFNLYGLVIFSKNYNFFTPNRIDLSMNPPGTYFVRVLSDNKVSTERIVISR